MNKFTKRALAAFGFMILMATVGFWTAPHVIAQIRAALIKDADQPARNFISIELNNGEGYTVPAGKILVIEQISAAGFPSGARVSIGYDGDTGPPSNNHRWYMYFVQAPGGGTIMAQAVRLYAKGGQTVRYQISAPTGGQLFAQGYLIDAAL